MMFAVMAVAIQMLSGTASAQSQCYEDRYGRVVCNEDRNIYDKHRNLINIGIGTAAGAIIGGLIGALVLNVGGVPLTLSTAGGALVAGIVGGWLRSVRPTFGRIPTPTVWFMNSVGLNIFISTWR